MRIPTIHQFRLEPSEELSEIDYDVIEVDLKPAQYVDDLGQFENEKELHKFVVRTKYYIRKSVEYTNLMQFLKKKRGMYCCGVHNNVNIWDGFQIEIHHTPLVIEDIIYIIINKRMKLNESLKMSAIADEVMRLHYLQLVGLYPLCTTCHEYAHGDTNDLFLPIDSVFGYPQKFFEIYDEYISKAMKVKFRNILELNKGYMIIQNQIPEGLTRKYIVVHTKNMAVVSTKKLYNFIRELNELD